MTIPVSQALLLKEYPDEKKPFAVALWSAAALSPFTVGPLVGGWVADNLGWHWLFYWNVPLPLFVAGIVWALLFDRNSERKNLPFDKVGFLLLVVALGSLQTVLNQGQDADWYNSPSLLIFTALGILSLAYFVVWELGERYPLLNLRLFARRNFTIGIIGLSVSFMMMYGLLAVLLARLQATAGYTSFMLGMVLVPLFFLAKPMAVFFHRIVHRYDVRVLGGGIGSPLLSAIWERRAAFHQHHLAETFSTYHSFDNAVLVDLNSAGLSDKIATATLAGVANQHAAILGVNDVFRLMAWIYIGLAVFVWFAHPVRTKPVSQQEKLRETELEDLVEEP